MDEARITNALDYLGAEVDDAVKAGKINSAYGIHGLLVLMHHRIGRWLEETDEDRALNEISGLAVDAFTALCVSLPSVDVDVGGLLEQAEREDEEAYETISELTEDEEDDEDQDDVDVPARGDDEVLDAAG